MVGGLGKRYHFGVCRRIFQQFYLVVSAAYYSTFMNYYSADRHFVGVKGLLCLFQRL
jgi:hypothetical protein